MIGLNFEMGRELLWRGFPTDQQGTYFKHFWGDDTGAAVCRRHRRPAQESRSRARHCAAECAGRRVRAAAAQQPAAPLSERDHLSDAGAHGAPDNARRPDVFPIFNGAMDPDVNFFGFPIIAGSRRSGPAATTGYFVVIQEHPTEPRFGLDARATRCSATRAISPSARSRRPACRSRDARGAGTRRTWRTSRAACPSHHHPRVATRCLELTPRDSSMSTTFSRAVSRFRRPAMRRAARAESAVSRRPAARAVAGPAGDTLLHARRRHHRAARARVPGQDSPRQPRARPDGRRADLGHSTTGNRTGWPASDTDARRHCMAADRRSLRREARRLDRRACCSRPMRAPDLADTAGQRSPLRRCSPTSRSRTQRRSVASRTAGAADARSLGRRRAFRRSGRADASPARTFSGRSPSARIRRRRRPMRRPKRQSPAASSSRSMPA